MNQDAIERLALDRMVRQSAELEVQLDLSAKTQPVIAMLALARRHAAAAMFQLVMVDPSQAEAVRSLQNEVRRYDDLVEFVKHVITAGKEADNKLSNDEKAEFASIFASPETRAEIDALGLGDHNQGFDA